MPPQERFHLADLLGLVLVLGLAAGTRFGYVAVAADQGRGNPAWQVQGEPPGRTFAADVELRGHKNPSELDDVVHHVRDGAGFIALAPLADVEEKTAHVAPGYYWIFAQLSLLDVEIDTVMRWLHACLGTLTVLCYYFFAWRAFGSRLVGLLAGILCALHPFWILNTAELNDGVLATFLLAAVLMLGSRGSQAGGVFTSLVFGLALAGLATVRAALLPFSLVGLLWYLYRCRGQRVGWLCALLACLGYANLLAPWAVRNFKAFGEPVPIAGSAYLHLWMGNNTLATGGCLDEPTLRKSLSENRLAELLQEPNQVRRYAMLGRDVLEEVEQHPQETCARRIQAGLVFLLGENWFRDRTMARVIPTSDDVVAPPEWLEQWGEAALQGSLLVLFLLGLIGWRWSFGWRTHSRLAALAVIFLPLPYLLTHAGPLSGPRLPLDGVLLCFTAFTLACLDPKLAREPSADAPEEKKRKK